MTSFVDLEVFVRTVDGGSFSAAARALDMTPAAASIAVKRLEQQLGARLLVRSTRSLRLTEEGARYLDSARLALGALAEGEQAIREKHQGAVRGAADFRAVGFWPQFAALLAG